jgi:hypothetical protein
MKRSSVYVALLFVSLILFGIVIPSVAYFGYRLPAEIAYRQTFGFNVDSAVSAGSFQGKVTQLYLLWQDMNTTFGTANHSKIYNSPIYWDQVPSNSIAYMDTWYHNTIVYIQSVQSLYQAMLTNHTVVQTGGTWYQDQIDTINIKYLSTSPFNDFTYTVRQAFFLQFYPTAWWFGFIVWGSLILGVISCIATGCLYDSSKP